MLIDSHAHLDDSRFDNDRDSVIKDLKDKGVELIINPGANLESSKKSVAMSEEYDNVTRIGEITVSQFSFLAVEL